MSSTERAIEELHRAGLYDEDSDYGGMIGTAVEELLLVFQKQQHSGFSAALVSTIFKKLVDGGVLTPLTGEDDEWGYPVENGDDGVLYQNKRDYSVFKQNDVAYDIDGIVFVERGGSSFTCKESSVTISFPYVGKTVYIYEGTPEAEPYRHLFEPTDTEDLKV